MTDEPLDVEAGRGAGRPEDRGQTAQDDEERENKGSPAQPWGPDEQRYSDRPEQGGRTPGPADGPTG